MKDDSRIASICVSIPGVYRNEAARHWLATGFRRARHAQVTQQQQSDKSWPTEQRGRACDSDTVLYPEDFVLAGWEAYYSTVNVLADAVLWSDLGIVPVSVSLLADSITTVPTCTLSQRFAINLHTIYLARL